MFESKSILALDLGNRNLRGTELVKKKNEILLKKYFFQDMGIRNHRYPDDLNLEETLHICLDVHNLKHRPTVCGIDNLHIKSLDLVDFPILPENELISAIEFELETKFSLKAKDISYDFYILNSEVSGETSSQIIKIFYCENSIIKEREKILHNQKLKPVSIDLDILSISTMLGFNGYISEKYSYIIIDMGETHTTVAFQVGMQVVSLTNVLVSLNHIHKVLNNKYNFDYLQTEECKNLLSTIDNTDNITNAENAENVKNTEALKTCHESYNEILDGIDVAINEYKPFFEKWRLKNIFLTGGGNEFLNCCEFFQNKYDIETILPNPFKNINIYKHNNISENDLIITKPHMFSVSIGMALREILNK
ncbi:MAG: pilus assembly protein PilM [Oligoflexia bacterium]|nr:pilus assembly protein PilM [Oligoflexia bacterium]